MKLKIFIISILLLSASAALCQPGSDINRSDQQGRKQGKWIKKYPNDVVMYEGFFKDDYPVGELKRYYEDSKLKSALVYSDNGKKAEAVIYHENGLIASKGTYINQMKEGKWQFFSQYTEGYLICEEFYSKNLKNGLSLKYYPDSTLAEKSTYLNNLKEGESIQYHPNGKVCQKANYSKGKMNGKFDLWAENGRIEISGQYKNDLKEGLWRFYKTDGKLKYEVGYVAGVSNNLQMIIDESEYLDSIEKNSGKIADPEKTGIKR
jgi:antitoxin component YwqK of YwqJK toxin-antitoxin module